MAILYYGVYWEGGGAASFWYAEWNLQVYSLLLKFETNLKIEVHTASQSFHAILKCNRKSRRVNVMDSVFNLFECSTPTPALLQSNSFCLKIYQFRETRTGSVNFGQTFYQNCFSCATQGCSRAHALQPLTHNNTALLVGKGKAGQQDRGGPSRHRRSSPRRPAGATLLLLQKILERWAKMG